MAGGEGASGPHKIKGGNWTVARFFTVSVAYTIVSQTIFSQLGYYKLLYGPSILLLLNIFYFLPSIPLLALSSFCDEYLDRTIGVAKTILIRLVFGLGTCGVVCALFPFLPPGPAWLLGATTVMGLVCGISYSASYQMVSRFAKKNTISLGLGCVGSGIIVLFLELGLQLGIHPSKLQTILLYEFTSAFVWLGFAGAISLLFRHWSAIEASIQPLGELSDPLIRTPQDEEGGGVNDRFRGKPASLTEGKPESPRRVLDRWRSFVALDPSDGMLYAELFEDEDEEVERKARLRRLNRQNTYVHRPTERPRPPPMRAMSMPHGERAVGGWHREGVSDAAASILDGQTPIPENAATGDERPHSSESSQNAAQLTPFASEGAAAWEDEEQGGTSQVLGRLWPVMTAIFLAGTFPILIFPFFTYIESSGLIGESLPKVIFFVRLFADITGRMLPRMQRLAIESTFGLMALALAVTASIPLFFLYLKAPEAWLNDGIVIGYVIITWLACGYLNTSTFITAPKLVSPKQKSQAAGLMAVSYQSSHCAGLGMAVLLSYVLFDGLHV
ncbi:hypothetical protein WJX84_011196 [Apatococcus fuscideae]|uniref:Uncharacterized protein n=1 Tax=Apatococcus fuscideae TaxID=2026836 RepID=A0AAW1T8S3_9CHLO